MTSKGVYPDNKYGCPRLESWNIKKKKLNYAVSEILLKKKNNSAVMTYRKL